MLKKLLHICSLTFCFIIFSVKAETNNPVLNKCRESLVGNIKFDIAQSTLGNIVHLERSVLPLENQKDIIDYYLNLIYDGQREQFLACRILLMKQQHQALEVIQKQRWQQQLSLSRQPEAEAYSHALKILQLQHTSLKQHKKLLSDKAKYTLAINTSMQKIALPTTCRLKIEESHIFQQDVFKYLAQQQDESCRRKVWSVYQQRGGQQAISAKKKLYQSFRHIARSKGFSSIASYQLKYHYLNHPSLVHEFLDQYPLTTPLKPWNIPQWIKEKELKTQNETLETKPFITEIMNDVGLTIEVVDENQWRLWKNQRLLGNLRLIPSNRSKSLLLRKTVVGVQYGISHLFLPKTIHSPKSKRDLVLALSDSLYHLTAGYRYYLFTEFFTPNDLSHVGRYWLLERFAPYENDWVAIESAQDQANLWRSYYAMAYFQNKIFKDEVAISSFEFKQLRDGSTYYKYLWQKQLAKYIAKTICVSDRSMFELLFEKPPSNIIQELQGERNKRQFIHDITHLNDQCRNKRNSKGR